MKFIGRLFSKPSKRMDCSATEAEGFVALQMQNIRFQQPRNNVKR